MEPPEGLSILCGGCHYWTELVGERSQRGDTIPQIEGSTEISGALTSSLFVSHCEPW